MIKAKAIYCLSLYSECFKHFVSCFTVDIQPNKMCIQFTRCIRYNSTQWLPAAHNVLCVVNFFNFPNCSVHSHVKILSIFRYFSFLLSAFFCFSFFYLCQIMIMSSENNFIVQNEDQPPPKQIIF